MDGKKKVPPPRPVTVAKKKMPVSDWLACGWALLSACAIALGHYHRLFCSQATLIVRCGSVELTGKKAIYFSALWIGALCCAAALALLLPRRHRWVSREDLAFLAVVLNSAGHCMYNGSVYILRRGDYFTVASLWFWVGDIISSLLLQGSVRLSFTLLRACATAFGLYHLPCSEATLVLRCACVELTGTKAAFFSALWIGILCCTASQAAAAALALLLPRRHRRVSRELASLSLVLATAGHSMYNGAAYLLRAEY